MPKLLWEPSETQKSGANLTRFIDFVNRRHGTAFSGYEALWDWSVEAIPAFIYFVSLFAVPRSPRWLIQRRNLIEAAERVLTRIGGASYAEETIREIREGMDKKEVEGTFSDLFKKQAMLELHFVKPYGKPLPVLVVLGFYLRILHQHDAAATCAATSAVC